MCSECPDFAVLLRDALVADDNHLSLVLYCDGVTPGSALGHDNKRKSVVWYASFAQFGTHLCHEELWMTLAVARTRALKTHPAKLSGFTRLLLRDLWHWPGHCHGVSPALIQHVGAFAGDLASLNHAEQRR